MSLNNALANYPALGELLKENMDNPSSFLQALQSFSDMNFKKAKAMFPDTTCEEFFYSAAIGFGIAKSTVIEETNIENIFEYSTSDGAKSPETLTIKPSFDDVMMHSFWATYINERFETNLGFKHTDLTIYDDIIKNNPDPKIYGKLILDTPANLEMMIKGQIMFIPIAHEYEKWYKLEEYVTPKERKEFSAGVKYGGNNILTKPLRETLTSYGLSETPHDLSDSFMEVGTVSMTYLLLAQNNARRSEDGVQLGDMGWATSRFIGFYKHTSGYDILVGTTSMQFAGTKKVVVIKSSPY